MDDRTIGLHLRSLRRRRRWRQIDVARAAGVSQALVSLVERGHLDGVTIRTLRAIHAALDARLVFELRWRGGMLDRVSDEKHALLVNLVVAILGAFGWTTIVEVSFNHYGDRGSIDILAWHPVLATLLVIEVKSEVTSMEELQRRLDVKFRLAERIAFERERWQPRYIATILVLPEETASRNALRRFAATFATTFPTRGREIRTWLRRPDRPIRGVWLLSMSSSSSGMSKPKTPHRIRRPRSAPEAAA